MQHVDMLSRLHEPRQTGVAVQGLPDSPETVTAAADGARDGQPTRGARDGQPVPGPPADTVTAAAARCPAQRPGTERPIIACAVTGLCDPGERGPLSADGTPGQLRAAEETDGDSTVTGPRGGTPAPSAPNPDSDEQPKMGPEEAREVNLAVADFLVQLSLKPESLVWYQKHDRNCRAIAHYLNHGKVAPICTTVFEKKTCDDF